MNNIFAFSGSNRNQNSYTDYIINKICLKIEEKSNREIKSTIFNINNILLERCDGCNYCFYNQKCKKNDNHEFILKQMLKADLLIIGSPVYLHNISSFTQNFLERFAYLSHTMMLSGKLGIIVSTSTTSGNNFIESYLGKILNYFGITIIDVIAYKKNIDNMELLNEIIEKVTNDYIDIYRGKLKIKTSLFQETIFNHYKRRYDKMLNTNKNSKEKDTWFNLEHNKFNDFQTLFNYKRENL